MLDPWLSEPAAAGVFMDFDGTLSAIVQDYENARPLPGVPTVLARLAKRYARVAVVSGRPVSYLAEHLGETGGTVLVGLYGMERRSAGSVEHSPQALSWQPAIDEAAAAAERVAPEGLRVERKGLAVTLHYRRAPHLAGWAEQFAATEASRLGLMAHPGKQSVELLPPVHASKGEVVAGLAEGLKAACFIGDDTGDLPAFAVLKRLRAEGMTTLAVAVAGTETPAGLVAAADLVVDGPRGALKLLEALAGGEG